MTIEINFMDEQNLKEAHAKLDRSQDFRDAVAAIADHWYMKGHVAGVEYRDNNTIVELPDAPSSTNIAALAVIIGLLCLHIGKVYLA